MIHVQRPAAKVPTLPAPSPEPLGRAIAVAVAAGGEVYVTGDDDDRGNQMLMDRPASWPGWFAGFMDGASTEQGLARPCRIRRCPRLRTCVAFADTGNALVRLISAASRFESGLRQSRGSTRGSTRRRSAGSRCFTSRPDGRPQPESRHHGRGTWHRRRAAARRNRRAHQRRHAGVCDSRRRRVEPGFDQRVGRLNEWLRFGP